MRTLFIILCLSYTVGGQSQLLKKLGKKAKEAAERTVERRVEQETSRKTDQTIDSIIKPGEKDRQDAPSPDNTGTQTDEEQTAIEETIKGQENVQKTSLKVYSKFDFVPGDHPLFFDDFSQDFVGDFPSKWNTNASGEVVTLEGIPGNWYKIGNRSTTIPNLPAPLPENYTIEFDLKIINLSTETSSNSEIGITLSEDSNFESSGNYARTDLHPCQYIASGTRVYNSFKNDPNRISNSIGRDLRPLYIDIVHVSIAVNNNRYRLWINESKIVDLPQFLVDAKSIQYLKLDVGGFDEDSRGEKVLISNLKVMEGGVDLRRKLLSDGKISTNGILFDSGSDIIKPESMGIIRQIYQVMQQDNSIRLNIIGHTDADGSTEGNQMLSEKRAAAVKSALVEVYGIDGQRLKSEGKGETMPVADNGNAQGKALNRRVEFVRL